MNHAQWQAAMVSGLRDVVAAHVPDAAAVALQTSDQSLGFGFVITGLLDAAGAAIAVPPGAWDALSDAAYEHLIDLDWNGLAGEDASGAATIRLDPLE